MEGIIQQFSYRQVYDPVYQVSQEYHIGAVWEVFLRFLKKFSNRVLEATAYTFPFLGKYEAFTITWWVVVDDKQTYEMMKHEVE